MKHYTHFLVVFPGLAAMALRFGMFALRVDHKGLLVPGGAMGVGLWICSLCALALAVLCARQARGSRLGASRLACCGYLALAVGIALSLGSIPTLGTTLDKARTLLGFAAAAALAASAIYRLRGKEVLFPLQAVPAVFLAIYPLSRFRIWSAEPQIQEHLFPLLGAVSLMLLFYQHLRFDAGSGSRRSLVALGIPAAFCCLTAAAHCEVPLLYLTGAFFALASLAPEKEANHDPS